MCGRRNQRDNHDEHKTEDGERMAHDSSGSDGH